jgi:signal transduction histidine kinase
MVRTIRELPPHTRRAIRVVVMVWLVLLALQVWDSREPAGARGAAELLSVVLGTTGFLLIGLLQMLRSASEPAVGPQRLLGDPADDLARADSPAVRQILMATPLVGSIAATCLASAIVLLVARVWLGYSPAVLIIGVVYSVALVVVLSLIRDAAARLYGLGQADAARAGRMETQLTTARLSALQAQMHPHFLFNALNTVAALTRSNPRVAESTVEHLAEVLRTTLERSQQSRTTLAEEVRFVRAYLAVEAQRFGDRLRVEWAIDPDAEPLEVPPFVLQPIVENALKHGIGSRAHGGRIRISAEPAADHLRLTVEDDGEGFDRRSQDGTGLGNLRERLAALYGKAAMLTVHPVPSGARVSVDLPAVAPAHAHASADR